MADDKIIIGYWDCRGLVHSAILMLEYLQKSYEFKTPSKDLIGPEPTYDKSKWLKAKSKILEGYDFPNLPHYFDPKISLKLTQSNAILMHIARTNDLWPRDEEIDLTSFCSPRKSLKKKLSGISFYVKTVFSGWYRAILKTKLFLNLF